jgi:hypothetical protein
MGKNNCFEKAARLIVGFVAGQTPIWILSLGALAATHTSVYAAIISVPPVQYFAQAFGVSVAPGSTCFNNGNNGVHIGQCSDMIDSQGSVSFSTLATASISGASVEPVIHAFAAGNFTGSEETTNWGASSAGEDLYFAINPGPSTGGAPPTSIQLDLSASGASAGEAAWTALLIDHTTGIGFAFCGTDSGGTSPCNRSAIVPVGDVYDVEVSAEANPAGNANNLADLSGHLTASADADPVISIDPAFLALHPGYSLVFGANASPSGVPESSTWALMIVGFAGLGFAGWRRGRGCWAAV